MVSNRLESESKVMHDGVVVQMGLDGVIWDVCMYRSISKRGIRQSEPERGLSYGNMAAMMGEGIVSWVVWRRRRRWLVIRRNTISGPVGADGRR